MPTIAGRMPVPHRQENHHATTLSDDLLCCRGNACTSHLRVRCRGPNGRPGQWADSLLAGRRRTRGHTPDAVVDASQSAGPFLRQHRSPHARPPQRRFLASGISYWVAATIVPQLILLLEGHVRKIVGVAPATRGTRQIRIFVSQRQEKELAQRRRENMAKKGSASLRAICDTPDGVATAPGRLARR